MAESNKDPDPEVEEVVDIQEPSSQHQPEETKEGDEIEFQG